ncbi:MAG: hypothetical protein ACR2MK_05215 [Solirubrobacteraceae bacterium]
MLRDSRPRVSRAEIVLLAALGAWALFPIVLLLAHASHTNTSFTGADGLIGADGVLGADQLQYLAWARDAGAHGLASDLFSLAPSGHVYLEPLFTITGALWRIGLSLQLAYLLWKPVAVVVLALAAVAWARRAFADQLAARAAAVALALFLYTPLTALFSWAQLGGGRFRFQLYLLGYELLAANKLWGYVPSAIGLALVPVALLAVERAIDPALRLGQTPRAAPRGAGPRVQRGPLLVAMLAALLASWLHPWQGITLIVIFVGLAVWRRGRRQRGWLALAAPAIVAALPLGYYYLLSHSDPAWKLASHYEVVGRLAPLVLLAGFGPLAVIAVAGLSRPKGVVIEQALLLWVAACFLTYFVNDAFAPHALQGLSFPFAVLAVRGWRRLRLPAAVGAVAVALLTIPGLAYDARKFARVARSQTVQYYLPRSDQRALAWVSGAAPRGGVLAPTPFAIVIPAQTGRAVWVGHGYWSRNYFPRSREANSLFRGRMHPARARAFVLATGAALLVSDCAHRADLSGELRPLVRFTQRFGCAKVYALAGNRRRSARP